MAPAALLFIFISSFCLTASFYYQHCPPAHTPYIYKRLDNFDAEYSAKYHDGLGEEVSFSLAIHQVPVNSDFAIKEPGAYLTNVEGILKSKLGVDKTEADFKKVFKLPSSHLQSQPANVIKSMRNFGPAWLMAIMRPLLDLEYTTILNHICQSSRFFSGRSTSFWVNEETSFNYQPRYTATKYSSDPNSPHQILEQIHFQPTAYKCEYENHTKGVLLPHFDIVSYYILDAFTYKLEFFNTSFSVGACNSDKTIESRLSLQFQKFVPSYLAPHVNETVKAKHLLG